jgi:hypothetical protein
LTRGDGPELHAPAGGGGLRAVQPGRRPHTQAPKAVSEALACAEGTIRRGAHRRVPFPHPDERRDYGEARLWAVAPIGDRLYILAFTMRGERMRAISLRKTNERERKRYEQRERP